MRLLIIGPQGAGKGTQATMLAAGYGIPHISTGDLFRQHIAAGTPLGHQVQRYTDAGALVPDGITQQMVAVRIAEADAAGGFLLDGFPRTIAQADWLNALLDQRDEAVDVVILLTANDDVLLQRLVARARNDDTPDAIALRLATYHRETAPLVGHYGERVISIDGEGDIAEVQRRIRAAIDTKLGSEV